MGEDVEGTEASRPRVFLLGENRWEETSRLVPSDGVDRSKNKDGTKKCLQCRGEGRLLCTGLWLSLLLIVYAILVSMINVLEDKSHCNLFIDQSKLHERKRFLKVSC